MALLDILGCGMEDLIEPGRRRASPQGRQRRGTRDRQPAPQASAYRPRRVTGGHPDPHPRCPAAR